MGKLTSAPGGLYFRRNLDVDALARSVAAGRPELFDLGQALRALPGSARTDRCADQGQAEPIIEPTGALTALPFRLPVTEQPAVAVPKLEDIATYRLVYFATHGLVAGDVKGLGEPSLAPAACGPMCATTATRLPARQRRLHHLSAGSDRLANSFAGTRTTSPNLVRLANASPGEGLNRMLIKTILVSHEVAEVCSLNEALMWVAFNRFPLGPPVQQGWDDLRRDIEHMLYLDPRVDVEDPTYTECVSVGLSPRPDVTGLFAPENVKEAPASGDLENGIRPNLEQALEKSTAFREGVARWDRELSHFLDLRRARLFMALREGKLVAEGIKLPEKSYKASLVRLRETDWEGWSSSEWISIPPDFWHSEKINWKKCWAEGRDATFAGIQIETAKLFACFPPPPAQAADVVRVANDLIAVDQTGDESEARKRGRPPFNWDSFHVEIAMRLKFSSLPEKEECAHC